MLNEFTPSQQMFMLFYSILYGIMLNSLIGLGAFPIAHFLAGEDMTGRGWNDEPIYAKGKKSRNRFPLSVGLLNFAPFIYFALGFKFLSSIETVPTVLQTFSLAFLSLSVFAFHQFFLSCVTCKRVRYHIYTADHFRRLMKEKGFYPNPRYHVWAGIFYLVIPWLVFFGFFFLNL